MEESSSIILENYSRLNEFSQKVSQNPDLFSQSSPELCSEALEILKVLFDHAKREERYAFNAVGNVKKLLIKGLDLEQIWQELQTENDPLMDFCESRIPELVDADDIDLTDLLVDPNNNASTSGIETSLNENSEMFSDEDDQKLDDSDDNCESFSGENFDEESLNEKKKSKKSSLDDDFFNLEEMIKFADEGENGCGLLTGGDESDEEKIYNMLYGDGRLTHNLPKKPSDNLDDSEDELFNKLFDEVKEKIKHEADDYKESDQSSERDIDEDETEIYYDDFFGAVSKDSEKSMHTKNASKRGKREIGKVNKKNSEKLEKSKKSDLIEGQGKVGTGDEENSKDVNMCEEQEEYDDDDDLRGATASSQNLTSFQQSQVERARVISEMEKSLLDEELLVNDRNLYKKEDELGLTRFSQEQHKIMKKLTRLEEESLAPKPWTMTGEVTAAQRPINSLLEVIVDHDFATKVAPQITSEMTRDLEEKIKERIKEEAFDDVIRRYNDASHGDFRPRAAILDDSKNAKSLAQIYEDEYMKQTQGADNSDVIKEHAACAKLFQQICFKCDALANSTYTPLKFVDEQDVKPVADTKAIVMEEVIPVTHSESLAYAPEEIYKGENSIRGESEWTSGERKNLRRRKKVRDAKGRLQKKVEELRKRTLDPKQKQNKNSISDAIKQIKNSKNAVISDNSDKTTYTKSSAIFEKIQQVTSSDSANKNFKSSEIRF